MNAGLQICANFSPWRAKEVSDILSILPSVGQVMNTMCLPILAMSCRYFKGFLLAITVSFYNLNSTLQVFNNSF